MTVQLHINGRLVIELTPETEIERAVLAEMRDGADRGKAVACGPYEGTIGNASSTAFSVEK